MTVARVLGTLGKTVIALGLIILLFGIFQLWGTGIIEARAQQDLDSEFSDLLEASGALGPAPAAPNTASTPIPPPAPESASDDSAAGNSAADNSATGNSATGNSAADNSATGGQAAESGNEDSTTAEADSSAIPDPAPQAAAEPSSGPPQPDPAWLDMLYRENGAAIARMQIPALNVDKTVVEGVRVSDLRKGPGHYPTSPLPGQAGNAAIAGHRTTYGAPFGEIDKLVPGDEIVVTTIQGEFTYLVAEQGDGHGHLIVAPTAVEVLEQDFRSFPNRLTLTACHPKGSARQRIIVIAELVGEPAPTYPRPGQGGLGTLQLADEDFGEAPDTEQTVTATPAPAPVEEATPIPDSTQAVASQTPTAAPDESLAEPTAAPDESLAEPTAAPLEEEADDVPLALPSGPGDASGSGNARAEPPSPLPQASEGAAGADSFGEGLDGDSDALIPAILWSLAALAIWLSANFAGRRWRRIPTYALSTLPFLVVMFMAFWHIDRILPSY